MRRLREWIVRLWASVRPGRSDAEIREELRLHLELAIEHENGRGRDVENARRAALARVGPATHAVNAMHDQRGWRPVQDFLQDVCYGLRTMRRTPLFASVVVLSLAIGTGAHAALYSLIEATLLREVAVEAPGELVYLQWRSREWFPDMARFGGSGARNLSAAWSPSFSPAAFEALRAEAQTLSALFAFTPRSDVSATVDRQAVRARMQLVSGTYFTGLRVSPAAGRVITDEDDTPSAEPAAVISHRFWKRLFEQSPAAVGATAVLDGVAVTIVGVAGEAFRGAESGGIPPPDFWIPLALAPRLGMRNAEQGFWSLSLMGRMKTGATTDQVRGNLDGPFRATVSATDSPPPEDLPGLQVFSARRGARQEGPNDELEHAIVLGVIFSVLLLIVCLNIANLLMSRSASRRSELAVRLALGAGRGRLIRQLLAETLTLAFIGGALGLVLAYWGKALLGASAFATQDVDLRINAPVFGVTMMISLVAGFLCGLVPAVRATHRRYVHPAGALELRGGRSSIFSRSLLVMQVATSIVILAIAGLLARTLGNWHRIEPGFDTDNLLVFQISPERLGYQPEESAVLRERLLARIRAIPGVARATASGSFWRGGGADNILVDAKWRRPAVRWLPVRHDFFDTVGLPALSGRVFLPEEDARRSTIAVVDQNFARTFFGPSSPIGRRFTFRKDDPGIEIVGVVGNIWLPGTRPEDIRPVVYLPARTRRADIDPEGEARRAGYSLVDDTSIVVRTAVDPISALPLIRSAVAGIEPDLPLMDPKTVEQGIRERLEPTRVASLVWSSFGAIVLGLTALGVYGILAFTVAQRTREIGIRTALGARRVQIIGLVTRQIALLVGLGITLGLGASLGATQLVRSLIFGVTYHDVPTLLGAVFVLVAVMAAAAFVPANRAAKVDPTIALRWE